MRPKIVNRNWRPKLECNPSRLRAGLVKFREALEQDAKEAAARGSGLPDDWRDRILTQSE